MAETPDLGFVLAEALLSCVTGGHTSRPSCCWEGVSIMNDLCILVISHDSFNAFDLFIPDEWISYIFHQAWPAPDFCSLSNKSPIDRVPEEIVSIKVPQGRVNVSAASPEGSWSVKLLGAHHLVYTHPCCPTCRLFLVNVDLVGERVSTLGCDGRYVIFVCIDECDNLHRCC